MGHTPGRGHRRKSDPAKTLRHQRKAARLKAEALKRYEEAEKAWEEMSDDAKRLRPELDPETLRPR
jgi:hypothetical protein